MRTAVVALHVENLARGAIAMLGTPLARLRDMIERTKMTSQRLFGAAFAVFAVTVAAEHAAGVMLHVALEAAKSHVVRMDWHWVGTLCRAASSAHVAAGALLAAATCVAARRLTGGARWTLVAAPGALLLGLRPAFGWLSPPVDVGGILFRLLVVAALLAELRKRGVSPPWRLLFAGAGLACAAIPFGYGSTAVSLSAGAALAAMSDVALAMFLHLARRWMERSARG